MAAHKNTPKHDPFAASVEPPGDPHARVTAAHCDGMSDRVLKAYIRLWCRFGKIQKERGSFAAAYGELSELFGRTRKNTLLVMSELEEGGWVERKGTSVYQGRPRNRWRFARTAQEAEKIRSARSAQGGVSIPTPQRQEDNREMGQWATGVGSGTGGVSVPTPQKTAGEHTSGWSEQGGVSVPTPVLENTPIENPSSQKKQDTGRIPSLRSGTGPGSADGQDDDRMMAGGPAYVPAQAADASPVKQTLDYDGRPDGHRVGGADSSLDAPAGLQAEADPRFEVVLRGVGGIARRRIAVGGDDSSGVAL
jgi:hypothetical protein